MTDHAQHPLLFLDVDRPLLPFGEDPGREPRSVGIVLGAVGGLAAGLVFAGAGRSARKTSATRRELRQSRRALPSEMRGSRHAGTCRENSTQLGAQQVGAQTPQGHGRGEIAAAALVPLSNPEFRKSLS